MTLLRKITAAGILALVRFQSLEIQAADLFITPDGAGTKEGTNWENALDQAQFNAAINERLQPGDQLNVGGGTYRSLALAIRVGGQAGKAKRIVGVDRGAGLPIFAGVWSADKPTAGQTALRVEAGVSHVTFQALRISGYTFCILAPPDANGAGRTHLTFDDVDMEQFRHGFYLSDCDDLKFIGCDLKRYTKHGFRFDQGCDRVTLNRCVADCSEGDAEWEKMTELFPFGFTLNNAGRPNTSFTFEDCVARNNLMPLQKTKYKNGDGFVIEGNSRDVNFLRCRALRNQDGGFDLKVPDVKLTDCRAVGNKRGFRIWTTGTLSNCVAVGGENGLWNNGGPLLASRCTIHAANHIAVLGDDNATQPTTLRDCIISAAPDATKFEAKNKMIVLESSIICGPKDAPPDYARPALDWDGTGDALDSRALPDKGYSSRRTPGL